MSVAVLEAGPGRPREMSRPTEDIAIAFARSEVPYGVIARCLMTPEDRVLGWLRQAVRAGTIRSLPPREWDRSMVERALRSRIDELEEQVEAERQRRTVVAQAADPSLREHMYARVIFGLSTQQIDILLFVMKNPAASKPALYHVLYSGDTDAADPKIIDVVTHRVRARVAMYGLRIETIWGKGYRIPDHHVAWWRSVVEACEERGVDVVAQRLRIGHMTGPDGTKGVQSPPARLDDTQRHLDQILGVIKKAGGAGASASQIADSLDMLRTSVLWRLGKLEQDGLVKTKLVRGLEGRALRRWYATKAETA